MAIVNHEYPVTVNWTGGRDGHGDVTPGYSQTQINLAVPPEFQGKGGAANPEELLTSAIAACYSITFGIVSSARRLPIASFQATATGTVEQNGLSFVYKTVTIRPVITLSAEATDEHIKQTEEAAHKADAYCIVTNAVRGKVEVTIEPTVSRA